MGSIDTDPASCEEAQKTVKASVFYTKEDSGLNHEWHGNVFLNPPYARGMIIQFIAKLITERENYNQTIVLVNNATEAKWFQTLAQLALYICFPSSRIKFNSPNGKNGSPLQGQAVFYIGSNGDDFRKVFGQFGIIMEMARDFEKICSA